MKGPKIKSQNWLCPKVNFLWRRLRALHESSIQLKEYRPLSYIVLFNFNGSMHKVRFSVSTCWRTSLIPLLFYYTVKEGNLYFDVWGHRDLDSQDCVVSAVFNVQGISFLKMESVAPLSQTVVTTLIRTLLYLHPLLVVLKTFVKPILPPPPPTPPPPSWKITLQNFSWCWMKVQLIVRTVRR